MYEFNGNETLRARIVFYRRSLCTIYVQHTELRATGTRLDKAAGKGAERRVGAISTTSRTRHDILKFAKSPIVKAVSKHSKQILILINAALIGYTESILVVLRHIELKRYALTYSR